MRQVYKKQFFQFKNKLRIILATEITDYPYITPMRKLIQSMPEMAELVFNRCMEVAPGTGRSQIWKNLDEVTRKTLEAEALAVRFNFGFMDDEFIIREWDKEWFY